MTKEQTVIVNRWLAAKAEMAKAEMAVKRMERTVAMWYLDQDHPDYERFLGSRNLHLVGRQIMQILR